MQQILDLNPLSSDGFSHTVKSKKEGIVYYLFKGATGYKFAITVYFCP